MSPLKEFYTRLGLSENPFAVYTTENENKRFRETFIHPNGYETILENFSNRSSIILTGDRGTGKTALIKDLAPKINNPNELTVQVTDFSSLVEDYKLEDFYKLLIINISTCLFSSLAEHSNRVNKLSKEDKVFLSYLLAEFIPQISKGLLKERIEKIQIHWLKRAYKKVEGLARMLFNASATTAGAMIDDYIAKHFKGIPTAFDEIKFKEYFPELPVSAELEFINQDLSYRLVQKIIDISSKLNFNNIVVFIDKIDEDPRFANDAERISSYIKPILTDNKVLTTDNLQVIFSVWLTPYNFIKDEVRTQKHYCPKLEWTIGDLERVLNQRLSAYSSGRLNNYRNLFEQAVDESDLQQIFDLANHNPRDLWHIFNSLLNSQFTHDSESSSISKHIIPNALSKYVTSFNYYEYYPRKANARANTMDIYSYAKHLLKLDSDIFTKNQLNEKAQIGGSINNYVIGMEKIGLIKIEGNTLGVVHYKINDPKIVFALKNSLELRNN